MFCISFIFLNGQVVGNGAAAQATVSQGTRRVILLPPSGAGLLGYNARNSSF